MGLRMSLELVLVPKNWLNEDVEASSYCVDPDMFYKEEDVFSDSKKNLMI